MTPKERRDAQIELRDWALELRDTGSRHETLGQRTTRLDRMRLCERVAAELDRVPEEQ